MSAKTKSLFEFTTTSCMAFAASLWIVLAGDSRWHTSTVLLGVAFGCCAGLALASLGRDITADYARKVWK